MQNGIKKQEKLKPVHVVLGKYDQDLIKKAIKYQEEMLESNAIALPLATICKSWMKKGSENYKIPKASK